MPQPHVLHLAPNFSSLVGGGDIFVRGLVMHLQKFNLNQTVVTNTPENTQEVCATQYSPNVKIIHLEAKKIRPAYMLLRGLPSILRENKFDIINVHGYGLYPSDLVSILKRIGLLRTPLILNTLSIASLKHGYLAFKHSFSLPPKQRMIRIASLLHDFTLGRIEMMAFDKVIILSEEEKHLLSKIGLKEKKIVKIPLAIDNVFFRRESSFKEREYILYAGRIDRYKGIQVLLKAIRGLKMADTKIKCLIVGLDGGYKRELELLKNELEIGDLVEIRDQVSQEDLVDIYSSALVTVLPSSSEGFPLSLVESMARGTPFISTPVGHIPELVSKTKAGTVIPIGDAESLTKSLLHLLHDRQLLYEMSENGKRFAQNYSWEIIGKMYYDLYRNVIEGT